MKAACSRFKSVPPTVAEHVRRRTGLRLVHGELGIRSGALLGFMGLREPGTHLVTLLSTFTWGTGRARKSLEARVTWISKEGSLVPQPPGGHSTGHTQRREQLEPGMESHTP